MCLKNLGSIYKKRIDRIYSVFNFISRNTFFIKVIKKVKKDFGLKKDDLILATFPKSGTTWIRFIFANIISLIELKGEIIDYKILNGEMRGNYDLNLYPCLKYHTLPRIISTHSVYDKLRFGKQMSIYLYRNPADVMVSFYEYRKGLKNVDETYLNFSDFIRSKKYGVESWCKHFISWNDKATYVFSYEELKLSPFETLKKLLETLNIQEINDEIIIEAIKRSSFENIRAIEERKGLDEEARKIHKNNFRFARKGIIGDWKNYFNKDDYEYLINKLNQYKLESIISQYYNKQTVKDLKQ